MNNNSAIGIFDSGLGGLTVVKALKTLMPKENIIYLGDTARVPYGDKSPDTILRFGCENASFLADQKVKLIIAACNTVSSIALNGIKNNFLKKRIEIPVLGVLEAGVQAVKEHKFNDVAIIGTRATISSRAYEKKLKKISNNMHIRSIACPLFAPIIEEGLAKHEIAKCAMQYYLNELLKNKPEAILLGCTHYPLLEQPLKKFFKNEVTIINSASATAIYAKKFLEENNLLFTDSPYESIPDKYFVTDSPEAFDKHAKNFMGRKVTHIKKAIIDSLHKT